MCNQDDLIDVLANHLLDGSLVFDLINNEELALEDVAITITAPSTNGTATVQTDHRVSFSPGLGFSSQTTFGFSSPSAARPTMSQP
ncbi:MAG TPA: hypothetical protein ENN01_02200 [Halothiobacillus sp.]|nr:hypothetical protein [Halothiobacillus sp.]